jgi:hypothetical protein
VALDIFFKHEMLLSLQKIAFFGQKVLTPILSGTFLIVFQTKGLKD